MKKLSNSIFIVLTFISLQVFAQEKMLTITDAVRGGFTNLAPKGVDQFQWLPGGKSFSVMRGEGENRVLEIQEIHAQGNGLKRTIKLEEIQSALNALTGEKSNLNAFPAIGWLDDLSFKFLYNKGVYSYHIGDKKCAPLGVLDFEKMQFPEKNPVKHTYAFVKEDNLFVQKDEKEIQITRDGGKGIVYGQAVHRNEFGINKGLFWNNDGTMLAFYRMDESMVTEYPLYSLKQRPAGTELIRYPIAGAASHHVKVGVYDMNSGKTIYLNSGTPEEQYLTNITWSPDGKVVYVAVVNRAQNHMWLKSFNPVDGNYVSTLFEEEDSRYVEPEHGPIFINGKSDKFIWFSERDGYNHVYLYQSDGKLIRQLTQGNWVVTDVLGTDKSGDKLFIMATASSALDRQLYCVNMKNGKMKRITQEAGIHTIKANASFSIFYDDYNGPSTPRKVTLMDEAGAVQQVLAEAENPLKEYKLGSTTTGVLKGNGGHDLHYRLYLPPNMDPNKRYPVIVYLYNGPHLQLVTNNWNGGGNLWYHYMAQKGYAVFLLDGRGSLNRGRDFENSVHRQLGTLEMEDQLTGVNWLKKQSWADSTRFGIHGWSFGGFMTTTMMSRAPGVFKVGVAGGPVIDWGLYEVMYTERYMDTPLENPEGYKNANLLQHIDKLQGKLLMIHGAQDDVVLWQHSLLYIEEAIKKGKQIDYFVYPHHPHNVGGKDRIHLMEKISQYFFDYL